MADQLLQAVHALYQVPDPHVKEQANAWLESWQQSVEAWTVSDSVLNRPDSPLEARYLCAQTLRTKISRDFDELPPQAVASLRESLARGVAATRTQLCLALAALATHVPAGDWSAGGVADPAWALAVELLGMLASEGCAFQPSLRPDRRRAFHDELQASLPRALALLGAALGRAGAGRGAVLEAFGAWLRFAGGSGAGVTAGVLASAGPLIDAALDGPAGRRRRRATTAGRSATWPPSPAASWPAVMALRPRFHVCCAAARREAAEDAADEGGEEAKALARLFAEAVAPVEALLDVAAHPADGIASISFNFWHRLSGALVAATGPEPIRAGGAGEAALAPGRGRRAPRRLCPAFERLVLLLQGRVRFPEAFDRWRADEQAEFKRARAGIADALIDAAGVLGGARTLELLAGAAARAGRRASTGAAPRPRSTASARCTACARAGRPAAARALRLAAQPGPRPRRRSWPTPAALTVGAYSDWLAACVERAPGAVPLDPLLRLLVAGLASPDAGAACALSLRRLCEGAGAALEPELPRLLALFAAVQGAGDVHVYGPSGGFQPAAGASEYEAALDEEDVQQLIEGVVGVCSALAPRDQAACLQQVLETLVAPVQAVFRAASARAGTAEGVAGARRFLEAQLPHLLALFDRITTVFKASRSPETIGQALEQIWPLMETALDQYADDPAAVERLCRVPRYGLRTAKRAALRALPALLGSLPPRFARTQHPAFLFVISEAVKAFGDDPGCAGALAPVFADVVVAACGLLGSLAEVSARPDLADDTFLLAGRALSYCPPLVLQDRVLGTLLQTALHGVLVQHREACCSILAFLARLLDPSLCARLRAEEAAGLRARRRRGRAPRWRARCSRAWWARCRPRA
ncbi:hypothetical protein QBZ16_002516 [Prototheca wickerhamii]|uniref:Importin N-terminal domain-containing protein n=1 Tax=Prototheca wickerhamii TaxID=3111 RepID=A0AAD9INH6_PROWI|nr:hypothetical protein QBZ16_002516 [Prototheca wickerhamii]